MPECVGCGYCCIKAQCWIGAKHTDRHVMEKWRFGRDRCPFLKWEGQRYVCTLMLRDDEIGAQAREELSVGAGCSSSLNSWRQDVRERG